MKLKIHRINYGKSSRRKGPKVGWYKRRTDPLGQKINDKTALDVLATQNLLEEKRAELVEVESNFMYLKTKYDRETQDLRTELEKFRIALEKAAEKSKSNVTIMEDLSN